MAKSELQRRAEIADRYCREVREAKASLDQEREKLRECLGAFDFQYQSFVLMWEGLQKNGIPKDIQTPEILKGMALTVQEFATLFKSSPFSTVWDDIDWDQIPTPFPVNMGAEQGRLSLDHARLVFSEALAGREVAELLSDGWSKDDLLSEQKAAFRTTPMYLWLLLGILAGEHDYPSLPIDDPTALKMIEEFRNAICDDEAMTMEKMRQIDFAYTRLSKHLKRGQIDLPLPNLRHDSTEVQMQKLDLLESSLGEKMRLRVTEAKQTNVGGIKNLNRNPELSSEQVGCQPERHSSSLAPKSKAREKKSQLPVNSPKEEAVLGALCKHHEYDSKEGTETVPVKEAASCRRLAELADCTVACVSKHLKEWFGSHKDYEVICNQDGIGLKLAVLRREFQKIRGSLNSNATNRKMPGF